MLWGLILLYIYALRPHFSIKSEESNILHHLWSLYHILHDFKCLGRYLYGKKLYRQSETIDSYLDYNCFLYTSDQFCYSVPNINHSLDFRMWMQYVLTNITANRVTKFQEPNTNCIEKLIYKISFQVFNFHWFII